MHNLKVQIGSDPVYGTPVYSVQFDAAHEDLSTNVVTLRCKSDSDAYQLEGLLRLHCSSAVTDPAVVLL